MHLGTIIVVAVFIHGPYAVLIDLEHGIAGREEDAAGQFRVRQGLL